MSQRVDAFTTHLTNRMDNLEKQHPSTSTSDNQQFNVTAKSALSAMKTWVSEIMQKLVNIHEDIKILKDEK